MKILIGTIELEVLNCYAYRYHSGKLTLQLEMLQEYIAHDELKKLLKENTEDIICTNDDGTQKTFSGFRYTIDLTDTRKKNEDGTTVEIYKAEIECVSEAEFQNGLLRQKISELNQTVAEQNEVINTQTKTINAQTKAINSQSESIALMEDVMLEQLMAEDSVNDVMEENTVTEEPTTTEESEVV